MEILVAGLGLIGGSMCMALKRAGHSVYGWNRSARPLEYALESGIIDGVARSFKQFPVVFVALPPEAAAGFINGQSFGDGATVSDICGVKKWMEEQIVRRNFNYVGCHPMAGKEVSTIFNASESLFDRASMVITRNPSTDAAALSVVRALTKDMGFKRIVECSAEVHDKKIAYTSQLAHIVSNAYVKSPQIEGCFGFTGGSFQDMTRIAGVDEGVWSSLYLKNAENLSNEISRLVGSLEELRSAVLSGDLALLEETLRRGRQIFDSAPERSGSCDIKITELK